MRKSTGNPPPRITPGHRMARFRHHASSSSEARDFFRIRCLCAISRATGRTEGQRVPIRDARRPPLGANPEQPLGEHLGRCSPSGKSVQMLHVKHSDAHKKRRITMDAAARFAGSRFMRLREIGAIRKGYSSSSTAGATTSGMDAVGSKRRTTLPSRSTRNFVKFHLMSGLPA